MFINADKLIQEIQLCMQATKDTYYDNHPAGYRKILMHGYAASICVIKKLEEKENENQ